MEYTRARLKDELVYPADGPQLREFGGGPFARAGTLDRPADNVALARLGVPVFLMNAPLSLSARTPNNAWMEGMTDAEREIDGDRAIAQFIALYDVITRHGLVYLLPTAPGLQDQTYVSNLGVVLRHTDEDTIILSRFKSSARVGEAAIGEAFFKLLNFRVHQPPTEIGGETVYLEGDAA